MPASAYDIASSISSAGLCSSSTGCPTSSSFPLCGGRGIVCGATVHLLGHQGVVARNGNDDNTETTSAVFVCFLQPPQGQQAFIDAGSSAGCISGVCNSTYVAYCGHSPSTFNGLWVACAQLTLAQKPGPASSAGSTEAVTSDSQPPPSSPSGGISSGSGTTGQASSSNTWAVAGGVIGAVAGIALLSGAAFFAIALVFARRRRSRRAYEEASAGKRQAASSATAAAAGTEPVWCQKDLLQEGAHHLSELESSEGKEVGSITEFHTAPNSRAHSADQQPSVVSHASVCVACYPRHMLAANLDPC